MTAEHDTAQPVRSDWAGRLAESIEQLHQTAVTNGRNVETTMTPEDPAEPAVIVAVIQQESLPDWTGLQDPDIDDEPAGARVIASRPAPVRFEDFHTGQMVRLHYREQNGVRTVHTGVVTAEEGAVWLGDHAWWIDCAELDLLQVLQPADAR